MTICLLLLAAGCGGNQQLDSSYGKRRGTPGGESVNGTAILAEMVAQAGHRVTTWRRLSPRLREAQVILWAPDDIEPPWAEVRGFLETWLAAKPGRILVYIGRDYDAAADYWRAVLPGAPAEQALELQRRLASAEAEHDRLRVKASDADVEWFRARPAGTPRTITSLHGPWSEGVDAAHTRITVRMRLEPTSSPASAEPPVEALPDADGIRPRFATLLADDQSPLAFEVTCRRWGDGRIIVVTNGSFLLNFALVNHEHRKLAQRLVDELPAKSRVVFLESEAGGPPILDRDPNTQYPTGMEALTVWPLGAILLHMTALGILACFVFFPIFGRPREQDATDDAGASPQAESAVPTLIGNLTRADFGRHVEALGELLERTGDIAFALARWRAYHQQPAGAGQAKAAATTGRATPAGARGGTPFGEQPAAPPSE